MGDAAWYAAQRSRTRATSVLPGFALDNNLRNALNRTQRRAEIPQTEITEENVLTTISDTLVGYGETQQRVQTSGYADVRLPMTPAAVTEITLATDLANSSIPEDPTTRLTQAIRAIDNAVGQSVRHSMGAAPDRTLSGTEIATRVFAHYFG